MPSVIVVGAGLAGTECAYQLAERGIDVQLIEQKPKTRSRAHESNDFAELVCSNSFRSAAFHNAVGLLKEELRVCGSFVMKVGAETQVPAGGAFAVDRDRFAAEITRQIKMHPRIEVVSEEVLAIPESRPCVLATGPLTSDKLASHLTSVIGEDQLAYYDAIAPVISADSINWDHVFRASRYDKGGDDAYVNCPLDTQQYEEWIDALLSAEKIETREFEQTKYFEGCLPIEVCAERGRQTLSFGCMKPVGLRDPKTGKRPHAVVQLRQENAEATAYNLVGFQTRMKQDEQRRVFRMIPGLEKVEFQRYGSVHRNTFVQSPLVLNKDLSLRKMPDVYLAGQITGVEGYIESAASGLILGIRLANRLNGLVESAPPTTTALGALMSHLHNPVENFQPSNVIWAMFPPLENPPRDKRLKRDQMVNRALEDTLKWHQIMNSTS